MCCFLVSDLFHLYTKTVIEMKKPESGIYTLERAIAKLQEHPTQLTTLHSDICQVCLLSKNFKPALRILDHDITSISKEVNISDAEFTLPNNTYTSTYIRDRYLFRVVHTSTLSISCRITTMVA